MLTQRAFLLGFVALCFYLIAVVNSLPNFYFALTWLSMGMLAASLGLALLSLVGLECRLEVIRSRGVALLGDAPGESGPAQASVEISNAGTLNKTNIILELRLMSATGELQTLRFLLEAIPSGAAIDAVLPLSRLGRGRYRLQEARLIGSDVLGLFRLQKRVAGIEERASEIVIGPAILNGDFRAQGGSSGAMAGSQRALSARHGEELRGTRPYAPGDDLRHVHWKSSARAGELVVKEFEQTGQSGALVMWDGAVQTTWGTPGFDSGEWGLIVAASLCRAFLAGGTPCDFARLDAAPLLIESRALAGGELPVDLLDSLSGASAQREIPLESAFAALPRLSARPHSGVILVSASLSSDLIRIVQLLRGRGARVQVVFIDAAALLALRRGGRLSAPKHASQGSGNGAIAVTRENAEIQCARLRECGAEVVRVEASSQQSAETTIREALRDVFQPQGLSRVAV